MNYNLLNFANLLSALSLSLSFLGVSSGTGRGLKKLHRNGGAGHDGRPKQLSFPMRMVVQ